MKDKNAEPSKAIALDTDPRLKEKNEQSGSLYPYNPEYENIEIGEEYFSIFEYLRQISKDRINIHPNFQRNQVWKEGQKSSFSVALAKFEGGENRPGVVKVQAGNGLSLSGGTVSMGGLQVRPRRRPDYGG
jgi:hypothetical protein